MNRLCFVGRMQPLFLVVFPLPLPLPLLFLFSFFPFFFHPFNCVKTILGSLVIQKQAMGSVWSIVCQPTSDPVTISIVIKLLKIVTLSSLAQEGNGFFQSPEKSLIGACLVHFYKHIEHVGGFLHARIRPMALSHGDLIIEAKVIDEGLLGACQRQSLYAYLFNWAGEPGLDFTYPSKNTYLSQAGECALSPGWSSDSLPGLYFPSQ